MLVPIRCFSCGKPIGHLWEKYSAGVNAGENPDKLMTSLGLKRYCCRRMFISHREFIDDVMKYRGK